MANWTASDVQHAIEEVTRRSSVDKEFRSLALSDPSAALARVSLKPVPPELKLRFIENQGNEQTIVLPEATSGIEELSDEEVEQVAGGVQAVRWSVGGGVSGS